MLKYERVPARQLREAAAGRYDNGRQQLAAMFANDERPLRGGMAVYCVFADPVAGQYSLLQGILEQEPWEFPSLTSFIPAAAWYEREIHDLFGLVPVGHPDLRPLVLHENWPAGVYPLRKDFDRSTPVPDAAGEFPLPAVEGEGIFEVPVGPIHAGIIEPGHFRFSQAGEPVINLEAKLFFTHRGIEKAVEGVPVDRAFYQVERICGACTVSHALSFSQAVEAVAGLTVSRRAQYIRVMAAELERLYNHVSDVGNLCAGAGFAVGVSHGSRMKEQLMRLNEQVAGNRFLRGLVVPGGAARDVSREMLHEIKQILRSLEEDFAELLDLLRENHTFLDRINTTGILPQQAARDLGVVGVAARASGIDCDLRRDFGYAVYSELDFKVPVRFEGDVAARLWLRADEVAQTIHILRQIMDGMPLLTGKLKAAIPALPAYQSSLGWSESARGGNLHWLMTGENNTLYRLFVRSASYSNWPALAVAVPGNIIPDFPLINKSFELCYACIDR
ncbi:respiratory chain nadh dehydrogenase 30 kd subunit signature [Lucifera butyrica]|uniref:Respiratory chain nadh dehydrogenase 30 kd subunit signature n=1 Tax=Lucifera butyrica TaxID=1351585 RepID=A0A498R9F8_9FIRM|nr:NADH-quinone oxidoreductase subunit C [Lucifera butyrica]VBB06773.1 respiratory chain nadh dehydrogenase 30 kd subunit signature [Lucifera butyrica]